MPEEKDVMTVLGLETAIEKFGETEERKWRLLTNSQDIQDIMFGYDLVDEVEIKEVGCLFIRWNLPGTLDAVYYCESNVPYHWKRVYRIK